MADREDIRLRVQRNLGRAGVTTDESNDINVWINYAIREDICADHNWADMEQRRVETTVAEDSGYDFPNLTVFKDCLSISIRRSASDEYTLLREISREDMDDGTIFPFQTYGYPRYWCRNGNTYTLNPSPDDDYSLRLRVWEYPADMTSDSDTNFVTLYYPKLLEFGVTARACLYYNEPTLYSVWQQAYETELRKAVSVDRRRLSKAHMTMRISTVAGVPTPGIPGWRGGSRGTPYDWT